MTPDEMLALRADYPGAYLEFEEGEVRLYCRSVIDAAETRRTLAASEPEEDATVYGGHHDVHEGECDPEKEKLMLEVLEDPAIQHIIALFGAELVDVRPPDKPPKFPR